MLVFGIKRGNTIVATHEIRPASDVPKQDPERRWRWFWKRKVTGKEATR